MDLRISEVKSIISQLRIKITYTAAVALVAEA